jgi:hypothetical protein
MIDRYLVVVVVEEEVEFLQRMHLSKNKNLHHPVIDNDVEHFNWTNRVYLIFHSPVLNVLAIL